MGCPSEVRIGDTLTFTVNTHGTDGIAADADSAPTWRLYEADAGTGGSPILNGTMAKMDDSNTTGFYVESVACTLANGFESRKDYNIYVRATVDGTTNVGTLSFGFRALEHDSDSVYTKVSQLSVGSGGISTTAESFTKAGSEPETNTYTATYALDGTYHIVEDDATSTDVYYQFDVGSEGVPQSVSWTGYAQSNGDSYDIYFYDWGNTAWQQVGTIDALNGTTPISREWNATTAHVGTGANLGKVRLRFASSDGTAIATDRIYCTYAVVRQTVGYANGCIWVDTNASNTNTEIYVDGTADNPVSTWAAALTLSGSLGITCFNIANGSSITLSANSDNYSIVGNGYGLALGGQSIDGAFIQGACTITGTGTNGSVRPRFVDCCFGAVTLPAIECKYCGFGVSDGQFTAGADGEYIFTDCYSVVAGSGTPDFDFSGLGAATGVNVRRWSGGAAYVLDDDCTLSHEVVTGGGTSVTTGGANVEIRGITRSVTLVLSGAGTVQFVGITGPVTISGTATTTVNLYGCVSTINDTSSGTTVTHDVPMVEADVTEINGSTTVDGKTPAALFTTMLANLTGRIVRTGSGYAYYQQNNSTIDHTLTWADPERTRS